MSLGPLAIERREALEAVAAQLPGRRDAARNVVAQAMRGLEDAGYKVVRSADHREVVNLLENSLVHRDWMRVMDAVEMLGGDPNARLNHEYEGGE